MIDGRAVQGQLAGSVPERAAGGILAGLGLLFLLRVIAVLVGALTAEMPMPETELAPSVSDWIFSPAFIVGGLLLWRREEFGYVVGLGLLFQASMLFIGLIVAMVLQPWLTDAPFVLVDVVVVFVLGMICFVPLVSFVRGVVSGSGALPT
jgi:hypothetical protein